MKYAYAFILGMLEFRNAFTTRIDGFESVYDNGRDWAHALTLRHFDK